MSSGSVNARLLRTSHRACALWSSSRFFSGHTPTVGNCSTGVSLSTDGFNLRIKRTDTRSNGTQVMIGQRGMQHTSGIPLGDSKVNDSTSPRSPISSRSPRRRRCPVFRVGQDANDPVFAHARVAEALPAGCRTPLRLPPSITFLSSFCVAFGRRCRRCRGWS